MTLIRLEVTDSIALVTLDNPPVNSNDDLCAVERIPRVLSQR
jgi:hypothetical protein